MSQWARECGRDRKRERRKGFTGLEVMWRAASRNPAQGAFRQKNVLGCWHGMLKLNSNRQLLTQHSDLVFCLVLRHTANIPLSSEVKDATQIVKAEPLMRTADYNSDKTNQKVLAGQKNGYFLMLTRTDKNPRNKTESYIQLGTKSINQWSVSNKCFVERYWREKNQQIILYHVYFEPWKTLLEVIIEKSYL